MRSRQQLRLSRAALVLSLAACVVNAQFIFPPPLERPLTDYMTGVATSSLNFSDGDNMFGGWSTPGNLKSFMLYRCVHPESSDPIYPSNSSFNSRSGHLADDGTWEQMPLYEEFDNAFGNGFDPGRNPIWFHGDFFAPNETTGSLCWFELYPGQDMLSYENGPERIATVHGDGPWYFASEPFTVNPRRPSGLTVTWNDGGPGPNILGSNSSGLNALAHEFPQYYSSRGTDESKGSSIQFAPNVLSVAAFLVWLTTM
ncbi:hypothetical protein B0I35DRAFT_427460 [Stachybotrys elegans]|uniref:Uncharacterized protein n=1 Tax=Stachybotrys elegans TaxID=80388 RepID=A0A8K0SPD5_9HYPO|nr:hypothetical protein B0I35DRAFT_427460 [Stachybotrys elegans]